MKKLILILIAVLFTGTLFAQATQGFKYPLHIGAINVATGTIDLVGITSGYVHVTVPAAAGTGTVFQFPANNGTVNYVLRTDGNGITTWVAQTGGIAPADTSTMLSKYLRKLNAILTGVPTAPTAAVGTNTTQIATTAFVNSYRRLNNHDSLNTLEEKAYSSLTGKPTLGTAAAQDVGYFATAAQGTDARTPVSHAHGNITNAGAIGSTATLPIITTTSGVLTAGSFGTTAGTFAQGNDSRFTYVDATSSIQGQLNTLQDSITALRASISALESLSYPIYYVSNSGSDDSSGLNPTAAWKTIAKVNASGPAPGSEVKFKKGDTWRETLTVPSSGTADSYITFGSYGTGDAPKILGSTEVTAWTNDAGNVWYSNNTVTDPYALSNDANIYFKETGGTISWGKVKVANKAALASEHQWEWESSHIYIYSPTDPNTRYSGVEVSQRLNSVLLNNKDYLAFDGLELAYAGVAGIKEKWPETNIVGLTVKNCTIHHIGIKGSLSAFGIEAWHSNTLIQNNIIHDCGRRGVSIVVADGDITLSNILIEGNTFYHGFHTTSVDLATAGSTNSTFDNITIRRNLIYEDLTETLDEVESLASMLMFTYENSSGTATISNVYIYNNIFKNITKTGVQLQGLTSSFVYNNTFYGVHANIADYMAFIVLNATAVSVIKNNVFFNNGTNGTFANINKTGSTGVTADYNLYYSSVVTRILAWNGTGYTAAQWATYKSASGQDAHSPTPADPTFVSTTDYHLQIGSPAIDTGISGTGIPATDFLGLPRVGATDIGAYEKQ